MAINLTYDTLEEIPEAFRELYTEKDGKFVLTGVIGMKTQADIDRLNEALRKEKNDHKATRDKYAPLADLEIDDVLEKLDKYPELEAAAGGKLDETKLNELVESRLRAKTAPLERQLAQANQKIAEQEGSITEYREKDRRRAIHDAVRSAATEAKLRQEALEDALLYGERVFDVDEDGNVITKDNVGVTPGVDPRVWLTEMQPKRPHWWGESSGGGARGGAGGGGGGANPWSAQSWNMTEQGRIFRENPERAKQMAASAGTTIGGPRPQPTQARQ